MIKLNIVIDNTVEAIQMESTYDQTVMIMNRKDAVEFYNAFDKALREHSEEGK